MVLMLLLMSAAPMAGSLMTATKTSAMLGVRTSPSPASASRSTESKVRMLRPSAWRSWTGFSALASASVSGLGDSST